MPSKRVPPRLPAKHLPGAPKDVRPVDRLQAREIAQSGTSPFFTHEPVAELDRSIRATCPVCSATFVATQAQGAEANLAAHMIKHAPAPEQTPAELAGARLVADVLTARIEAGELKPGQPIRKAQLARQLDVSRFVVDAAVDDLISVGQAHLRRVQPDGDRPVRGPGGPRSHADGITQDSPV